MVLVSISLLMAVVMMAAAAGTLSLEHRGEMYRQLKKARAGQFKDLNRN